MSAERRNPGPWIPTAAELHGGDMDLATEEAVRSHILADQYGRGTPEGERELRWAQRMKDCIAQLRIDGPFDAALDYQRLRGGVDSAEDGRAR